MAVIPAGNQYLPRTGEALLASGTNSGNLQQQLAARTQAMMYDAENKKNLTNQTFALKAQLQQQALAARAAMTAAKAKSDQSGTYGVGENGSIDNVPMSSNSYNVLRTKAYTTAVANKGKLEDYMPVIATAVIKDKKGKVTNVMVQPNPNYKAPPNAGVILDPTELESGYEDMGEDGEE